jgi:hypothetical protein
MKTVSFLLFTALSITACSKSESAKSEPAKSEPAKADTAPAKAAEPAAPAAAPAAAATSDVDLAPGGDKFKGWAIKAPAGTTVTDNGAGGASIVMGDLRFEMPQGDLYLKDVKDGNKSGAELSKAKFTYTVDKPDALEWTSETPAGEGTIKGYGFSYYVDAKAKIGCTSIVDDEKQVAAIKAVCNSLHKK